MWWMLLVLFYGVLKGIREVVKKMALKKNGVIEVLFFYTFLAFLFVFPQAKNAGGLEGSAYFGIALKAFFVFLAWIFSFRAINKMPISLYGVLDLSRVLFATLLGVIILNEKMSFMKTIGLILVSSGLLLLKYRPSFLQYGERKNAHALSGNGKYVLFALFSCVLNALSGLMDKILMQNMSSSQLQFWYMLFMLLYYGIYMVITKTKLSRDIWKNGWIWLLSILFVVADKALFIANGMEGSQITVMTLLKQSGCVVTILAGKFIFKEKKTGYKLFCAAIIVLGIVIGVCEI
ncbi:MAG: EamA family transporter [Lachnospiraceae bacterium]|nr:EamA family transporter [Lachnospiraceae bacterium]